jgi:hypothetical protein
MKDRFYEALKRVFDKFPKYHMQISLGDFNVEVFREYILKPKTGTEGSHENNNDNGIRLVNFAISKNLIVKVQCYLIVTFINLLGHLLMKDSQSNLPHFDREKNAFKCTRYPNVLGSRL